MTTPTQSRRRWFGLVVLIAMTASVWADDFWRAKPYQEWSKAETEKMLKDSPWARHITLSSIQMNMSGVATGSRGVTGVGSVQQNVESEHSDHPTLTYTAQLRSARPIRQAVVRDRQLQEHYGELPADRKAALDAKTNAYLAQAQDDIVVYVTYQSNVGNYVDLTRRYWTQQTYDLIKNTVFLTVGRERLAPVGYAATNGAFQFNFPRPAALPADGSVVLEFMHPGVGAIRQERVVIEFKLKEMTLDGAPAL